MSAGPRHPEVVVIGEALIDVVKTGEGETEHVGGSPANVALGLGRRGVRVALLTQLGRDARGRAIEEHLRMSGVEVLPASFSGAATSTATAVIDEERQAHYEFDVSWNELPEHGDADARVVHVGSVAAFLEPGASSMRRILESSDAEEITFDPNIRPALLGDRETALRTFERTARLATVVKLSDEDAAWLYPGLDPDDVVDRVLALGPRMAVITLGAAGALIANAEARARVPGVTVAAVDTIGAGDTFMASLIHFVLEHGSAAIDASALGSAAEEATRAAAITVSRAGADLPWANELVKGV